MTNDQTPTNEPVCKFDEGCHRVVLCKPGCGALAAASPVPPSADQTALRDRIRRAICEAEGFAWDTDMLEPDEYGEVADMVLAVLPEPTNRAVVLLEAAQHLYTALFPAVYADMGQKAAEGVNRAVSELRRVAAEEQPAETETVDRPAVLLEIATTLDGLAETDMIRKRRSLGTARRLLAVELRRMAEEQTATEPAVGEQPDTQEAPVRPCNYWTLTSTEHTPHNWVPQPGMDPVQCPGYDKAPE